MKNGSNPRGDRVPADPVTSALAAAIMPLIEETIERLLVDLEERPHRDPVPLMDTKALAEYLSVSMRQVQILRESHGLPTRKVGDSWRYDRGEVDAWTRERSKS